MKSSGKETWKNQSGKVMQNLSWRKLHYWCQIGVSGFTTLDYRNEE